jgi:hypothetical protein
MTEIIDVGELYYKEKWQGERLLTETKMVNGEEQIIYPLHATNISHCITKTCLMFRAVEAGELMPFNKDSQRKMEVGKAFHKLHQQDGDWKISELYYDERFGWYPPFHCTREDHEHWIPVHHFIEKQMMWHIKISDHQWIAIKGTLDEFKLNSKGFFIEDIKTTFGFKWIKGAKENHKIQVHTYMWIMEQKKEGDILSVNFPMITYSREMEEVFHKELYSRHKNEMKEEMTFEEYFDEAVPEDERCYWNLDFTKCHNAQIKYVDAFNPMRVKICDVPFRRKYFDHIEEQIEKYKNYLLTGELPEPNYDLLASWECDPKYCPFSADKSCKYRVNDTRKLKGWPKVYALVATILTLLVICPVFWILKLVEFMTKETWIFWKKVYQLYVKKAFKRKRKLKEDEIIIEDVEKYI